MRRILKPALLVVGVLAVLFVINFVSSIWRYYILCPKVSGATITVDGRPSPESRIYADLGRFRGLVVRREPGLKEYYFIAFGKPDDRFLFVWRCDEFSFSFLPGLAFSNHIQFGQGCLATNLVLADSSGKPLSGPKKWTKRNLRIEPGLVAFSTDDGKSLKAVW
jgi:hypothetical protein